jgi:FixJ family two-component response regulator
MCRCHGHQPAGLATLSRREREIAELVGAGKTNREIATACYLSEKTVKRHLSNIFTSSVSPTARPLPARLRASLRADDREEGQETRIRRWRMGTAGRSRQLCGPCC